MCARDFTAVYLLRDFNLTQLGDELFASQVTLLAWLTEVSSVHIPHLNYMHNIIGMKLTSEKNNMYSSCRFLTPVHWGAE